MGRLLNLLPYRIIRWTPNDRQTLNDRFAVALLESFLETFSEPLSESFPVSLPVSLPPSLQIRRREDLILLKVDHDRHRWEQSVSYSSVQRVCHGKLVEQLQ